MEYVIYRNVSKDFRQFLHDVPLLDLAMINGYGLTVEELLMVKNEILKRIGNVSPIDVENINKDIEQIKTNYNDGSKNWDKQVIYPKGVIV